MLRVLVVSGVCACMGGCASDPELARYIGNERVLGSYTEYDLRNGARDAAGVAGAVGLVAGMAFGCWWYEGYVRRH
jgi:hypothetical protein